MEIEQRCWAEVDLGHLAENFQFIREHAGDTELFAVVKANAYGHGAAQVARELVALGAKRFAVACLAEAVELRQAGISQPVLILGYTRPENAAVLAVNGFTAAIAGAEEARALAAKAVEDGVQVEAHLKIDTGMGRIGFCPAHDFEGAIAEMEQAACLPGLSVSGAFTHFSAADSAQEEDIAYTQAQFQLMRRCVERLRGDGIPLACAHCSNSAALVSLPQMRMDAVRPGIILYGCDPSADLPCPGLHPLMELKATVARVKELAEGDCVSYGRTFRAPGPMRVATLTVGYADGYPRALSSKGVCAVNGIPAPVVGRVCMDQMMVDVTHCGPVKSGDIATVFGGPGADTVQQAADKAGTIPHELTCGIGPRVPRIYRGGLSVGI